jgi:hypothetical protein
MTKILYSIDSLDFELNKNSIISLKNVINIKLINAKVSNSYAFISSERNNNFFNIKGISTGLPTGPDIFHYPIKSTKIVIPEGSYTIDTLIHCINNKLQEMEFNINKDNKLNGIFWENINGIIKIINTSYHYDCEIDFNESLLNKICQFSKNNMICNTNNVIYSKKKIKLYDDFIFLKINSIQNIFFGNMNYAFSKLLYNEKYDNFIVDTNGYFYEYDFSNSINIDKLSIDFLDYLGNNITNNILWHITLEFKLYNIKNEEKLENVSNVSNKIKIKNKKDYDFLY